MTSPLLLGGIATSQPLDADLTSIAALTTTSFGRGLLDEADAAAVISTLGLSGQFVSLADAQIGNLLTSGEEVIPRHLASGTASLGSSQRLVLTYFTARKTEAITQVRAVTAGTAAGATPTLARMGFYSVDGDGDLTLEAACANDTALFGSTNTRYTRNLTATFNKVLGQRYAFAVLVDTGAALPTFYGANPFGASVAAENDVAPTISARVTGQTDLPASIAVGSLTQNGVCVYGVCVP